MIGLPFTIRRYSADGAQDEVVYLRTYRKGERGTKMRKALREYIRADFDQNNAATRVGMSVARAGALVKNENDPRLEEKLQKLCDEQQKDIAFAQASAERCIEAAGLLAELAIEENYGEAAAAILDKLTDKELRAIAATLQTGAMPKDFFPSLDIQQKQKPIGQTEASSAKPS